MNLQDLGDGVVRRGREESVGPVSQIKRLRLRE